MQPLLQIDVWNFRPIRRIKVKVPFIQSQHNEEETILEWWCQLTLLSTNDNRTPAIDQSLNPVPPEIMVRHYGEGELHKKKGLESSKQTLLRSIIPANSTGSGTDHGSQYLQKLRNWKPQCSTWYRQLRRIDFTGFPLFWSELYSKVLLTYVEIYKFSRRLTFCHAMTFTLVKGKPTKWVE